MRKSELLVFSLLLLNFVSATTLAQTGPWVPFDLKGTISFILGNPNVPSDWLVLPNLVYYIIFPFIAIVSVLYGIFSEIRIFKSTNVKFILAFVMAGMSLPTGLMISTVYFLYTLGTWIAVIAFGFLFIFGTILWAIGRGSGLKRELFDLQSELGKLKKNLTGLMYSMLTVKYLKTSI